MEAGEEGLQRSADALHQAYSDTDPELWEALNGGPQYPDIGMSVSFDIKMAEAWIYIPFWIWCVH